jgi:hypothetical protein
MRDLFSSEMTAQRELHDRVAKAHLDDFKDQLTTQTGTTISFALANMPLQAPPEAPKPQPPRVRTPTKAQGRPRPPTLPTDILPQQPPQPPPIPTAAIPTTELALADGTGGVATADLSIGVPSIAPQRSKTAIVIGLVASIVVVAVVIYAMTRKDDPKPTAAKATQPPPQIRVEAIPPDEQTPTLAGGDSKKVEQVAPPIESPPKKLEKVLKKTPKKTEKAEKAGATPKEALTRDAVIGKFRAVKAAYDTYKQKNGGRYDTEWNDLASFSQYHPNDLEELARRIESFRAKLRE